MLSARDSVSIQRVMKRSLSAASVCSSIGRLGTLIRSTSISPEQGEATPALARGAPMSSERLALIEAFMANSAGVDTKFESRTFRRGGVMPYRLFRPGPSGRLPLVLYLHGSGGLGSDNEKQMGLGNIFGTRVWAMPENQKEFPCYVVVPQTNNGWVRYAPPSSTDSIAHVTAGLGEGARLALEIVDALCKEFRIDERRIYVTGQSLGGSGVWHMTAHRPGFLAAAVPCCGSPTAESPAASVATPVWNFHGDADESVPVALSRDRVAALRVAGGHPLYTEYPGVGHNVWQWAYTEPALLRWVFAKRRTS